MIEKDPNGLKHAPGAKLDKGKVQAALLTQFNLALLEVAKVATYGAHKYSKGGWKHVEDGVARYDDAKWRHGLATEAYDPSTKLIHLAQEVWNGLAVLQLSLEQGQLVPADMVEVLATLGKEVER